MRYGFVLVLLLAATAAAEPPEDSRSAYARALEAFQHERWDDALTALDEAYRQEPKAIYLYNRGRVLEAAGRLVEANEAFLRAKASPDVTDDLSKLLQFQIDRVTPLLGAAWLRFKGTGAMQVDGQPVTDLTLDLELAPGNHLACLTEADGARVRCWRLKLRAGSRIHCPPLAKTSPRGSLVWEPNGSVLSLTLAGHPLAVNLATLREIDVEVGSWEIEARVAAGGSRKAVVEVRTGAPSSMAAALLPETPDALPPISIEDESVGGAVGPWATVGMGGAVLTTGAVLLILGAVERAEVSDPTLEAGLVSGMTQSQANEQWESSGKMLLAGGVLAGIGAAGVAAGVAWLFVAPAPEADSVQVWLSPIPGGGLLLEGRF